MWQWPLSSIQFGSSALASMDPLLELNLRVDFVRHENGSLKGAEGALAS